MLLLPFKKFFWGRIDHQTAIAVLALEAARLSDEEPEPCTGPSLPTSLGLSNTV